MSAWTMLLFGRSGSYKTSELRHIARRTYAKYGKITRLVSSDGGGWTPLQPEIDVGIIEPWRVTLQEHPISVYRKLSKGYWPKPVQRNGQRELALVEPNADTWKRVGAYLIEGLTSISAVMMRDHIINQRKLAEDPLVGQWEEKVLVELGDGKLSDATEKYMTSNWGHFNSVQQSVYEIVTAFSGLPLHMVGFTALETAGEERVGTGKTRVSTGRVQIGPQVIGQAMTTVVPAWVGDCIHMDTYNRDTMSKVKGADGRETEVKTGVRTNVRAYYVTHPDLETGITVAAKPRVPPERWPALMQKFPGGYYTPTPEHGLDLYLDAEEELINTSAGSLRSWKEEVDSKRAESQANEVKLHQAKDKEVVK